LAAARSSGALDHSRRMLVVKASRELLLERRPPVRPTARFAALSDSSRATDIKRGLCAGAVVLPLVRTTITKNEQSNEPTEIGGRLVKTTYLCGVRLIGPCTLPGCWPSPRTPPCPKRCPAHSAGAPASSGPRGEGGTCQACGEGIRHDRCEGCRAEPP
jgi:hypothetical protein